MIRLLAVCLLALLIPASSVFAGWTSPTTVSDTAYDCQWPRLATGSNGSMHIVYRHRIDWRIGYRLRSASGAWSSIEYPDNHHFQDQPDIIEDAQGRAHIYYTAGPGRWPENYTDLFEAYRVNGVWTISQITNTPTWHEGYARVAKDSHGNIHLVYLRLDLNNGTAADVYYRKWDNTAWSADTYLGHVENLYYHAPDICCDSADNLHVVWVDHGGSRNVLVYRKFNGTSWLPAITVGYGAGKSWLSYPKVTAATTNNIVAAVNDDSDSLPDGISAATSADGGITWSAYTQLNTGNYVSLEPDGLGNVYMVYEWETTTSTGFRKWNGSAWSYPWQFTSPTIWQLSPDVGLDDRGNIHCVFENHVVPGSIHYVSHMMTPVDNTPPTAPPYVTDDGASTDVATSIHASWGTASDPESGVDVYEYSLGTSPGATDILAWKNVGLVQDYVANTFIAPGTMVYVNVRAVNGQGGVGPVASSDGIRIAAIANAATFITPSVVSSSAYACDAAMLAKANDGGLHLVYRDDNNGASKIVYRKGTSTGSFGAFENVTSGSPVAAYPDVCEDTNGKVHVVYTNSKGREAMDVFEAVKTSGTWSPGVNLSNNNTMDWYPYITPGTGGRLWLVENGNTTSYGVKAANFNGTWSAFTTLGASVQAEPVQRLK